MDTSIKYGNVFTAVLVSLLAAALLTYAGYLWSNSCRTLPAYEGFQAAGKGSSGSGNGNGSAGAASSTAAAMMANPAATMAEGFWAGPTKGAGAPDCLRTNSSAAAIYDIFSSKVQTTEEGPDDLRELTLLLGKLSCFKKDLMSTASLVEATRYQPFNTSHDLEPIAETTARCFAGTLPRRDLEISLEKWGTRGTFLIKRLCTSVNLRDDEEEEVLRLFGEVMADVSDIALGRCCAKAKELDGGKSVRMVGGFEPPSLGGLRPYEGYY